MKIAGLFVDDLSAAGGRVHDRKVGVIRELRDLLRGRVVAVDVELTVAVGAEVDLAVEPHRIGVVAASGRLRHVLGRVRGRVEDDEIRDLAAAIVLPFVERVAERDVDDLLAVRRIDRLRRMRNRQLRRHPAADRHGEELDVASRVDLARRGEEDIRAIRREPERDIRPRMPRQPLRHAALGRHDVNVRVAFVAAGEGDPLPVRREARPRLDAGMRRQPPHAAAVEVRDPEIVRVSEGDPVAADGGIGEKPRVVNVDREQRKRGQNDDEKQQSTHAHRKLLQGGMDDRRTVARKRQPVK